MNWVGVGGKDEVVHGYVQCGSEHDLAHCYKRCVGFKKYPWPCTFERSTLLLVILYYSDR